MKNIPIIYFDLDGVLFDFEKGVHDKTGVDLKELGPEAFSNSELKASIFGDPTFFRHLDLLPGAHDMIEHAKQYGDVQILSATGYSAKESIAAQKREAVLEHFGELPVHLVEKSHEKARFAWYDIILIDDRLVKSIIPFRERNGIGIHHTDPDITKSKLTEAIKTLNESKWNF